MPNFIFAYHGGNTPETPEEGEKVMAAWNSWYADMGTAVIEGGGPVGKSSTVSKTGVAENGGANPLSGYSVISAADMMAACAMAKNCPMVKDGTGSVEIAEVFQM